MFQIDKVQISINSGFNLECAMELANLLSVAYDEYEVWDNSGNQEEDFPPKIITASKAFVDLPVNQLEEVSKAANTYGRLDKYWEKTDKVEKYDRLGSFWLPEWWWGEVLKFKNLWEFLKADVRNISQGFRELIGEKQLFGFIARSMTQRNKIFVVFRGTREAAEWFNNFRPVPKAFLEKDFEGLGEVRNGFNLIYTSTRDGIDLDKVFKSNQKFTTLTIEETITQFFEKALESNDQLEIFVTGHSLGAGLATLAALHIKKIAELKAARPSIQLYTFASPRVGDEVFASHFNNIQCFRVINSEDLIQAVPLPTTKVVDEEVLNAMNPVKKARFLSFRAFLEGITGGQSGKCYQL
jgi:hypothetical protein